MRIAHTLLAIFLIRWVRCGDSDGKGVVKGADKQNPPKPTHPASSLASKVDGSLFNVEESLEGNVPVLKLTSKKNAKATKLTFDGQTVWEDDNKLCLSAVSYLDEGKPTMTAIKAKGVKGGANFTLYRYHDGNEWKDGKEEDHKKKLEDLKERCKPGETLDLSNPDTSKLDVHTENAYGVSLKEYTPKSAFHISSLTDGDKELWKASGDGQKCKLVESYSKGALELLYLETSESTGTKFNYFEKTDGKWKDITEKDFNSKFKEIAQKGN
ncbi:signal peptide containing protein [Theileria equi strain WA]|uniref:Signal peptide containing protein n=1 Tax=Theileria equi strain WA TaxID=1537102 RepID=L1LA20_THEEQ|nr:signal peptide containing protein [Theileria equi strain WA]EKX72094.1 signal peptide containing protein [Theileria equi strain WA]|eukprot:XP_004831546.1 signal peptide containing protein [Theileria equi strain WA]